MKLNNQLTLQRLIGKIDNDFNISESDWIPRVAAWTIDALSQLDVLPMVKKCRELEVVDRIAQFPCKINAKSIKVFDSNGCEIPPIKSKCYCGCEPNKTVINEEQIQVADNTAESDVDYVKVGTIVSPYGKAYVLAGNNIELTYDTDTITVESYEVATYYDEYYDTYVPYIYDNGLLLEALSWYCLFKYLSRGSKHTVYSLNTNNPTTNPYIQWMQLKNKAANSVKKDLAADNSGWNNFFYNSTFLPRN